MRSRSSVQGPQENEDVLRSDSGLAERLDPTRRAEAEGVSGAGVLTRDTGIWRGKDDAHYGRDGVGLLVLRGLLVRRVGLEGRLGAELLGDGDLLQPAMHDGEDAVVPFESTWRVMVPLRLAILDLDWLTRMAPYPEVAAELTRRVMIRSRRLATMLAIAQHHRLDDRLRLFFWELADRYGRVNVEGVRVDVPLTHELIGHLVGARRPSVSAALSRLEHAGYVRRRRGSWLLLGTPLRAGDLRQEGNGAVGAR